MRSALGLSDNQIAVLQGFAMAIPMAVGAIPLGFLIDRHSRVRLLLVFSLVNVAGGLLTAYAPSLTLLVVARCLVGLMMPAIAIAAYSLVADLYPPSQRGRANMVMAVGQAAGMSAVFALGGVLIAHAGEDPDGWRWAMLWLTSPLLLIAISTLVLREPERAGVTAQGMPLRKTLLALWRYRAMLLPLFAGMIIVGIADCAALIWAAPTLTRNFGLSPARVGSIMATILLLMGVLGPLAGGTLADLCQRTGGPRRTMTALTGLALLSVPASFFPLLPGIRLAATLLLLFVTIGFMVSLMFTTLVTVVIPNELRGLSLTISSAASLLIGGGLAPILVSFSAHALGGPAELGKALALVCISTSVLGAMVFAFGRHFFLQPSSELAR
jgi:MFS family permease